MQFLRVICNAVAGQPQPVNFTGDFLTLISATGKITIEYDDGQQDQMSIGDLVILDKRAALNQKLNPMEWFKRKFNGFKVYSTVANDTVVFRAADGDRLIPLGSLPGSTGNTAVVAASVDEVSGSLSIASPGSQSFAPVFACPTFAIDITGILVGTTGSIQISAADVAGNSFFPPVYDQEGNQVSDGVGVIQAAQLFIEVNRNSFAAHLFIDGTSVSQVTVQNNTTINPMTVRIMGTHMPASLMQGQKHTDPGYIATTQGSSTYPNSTADFIDLTPPVGGTPKSGRMYLQHVRLWLNPTVTGIHVIQANRRKTLNSGGTSTSNTDFPKDPLRASGLATIKKYTVAPASGILNDTIFAGEFSLTNGVWTLVEMDWRQDDELPSIPFYNGSTWQFGFSDATAGTTVQVLGQCEYKLK